MYDKEHLLFIKKEKSLKLITTITRIAVLIIFLLLWEIFSYFEIINPFIFSSPYRVFETTIGLIRSNELFIHIFVTCTETVLGFVLGTIIGTLFAMLLWWFPFFAKVADPYLVVLNALPKVALGPIIIVWAGAGFASILTMALSISLITTIIGVYSGFMQIEEEKITLLKTFGASKIQIFSKVIFPASVRNIINALKINVGLSFVGVIMGEFLVSKAGLGYLIMYGSQVFNLDLVMACIVILALVAGGMYFIVSFVENYFSRY